MGQRQQKAPRLPDDGENPAETKNSSEYKNFTETKISTEAKNSTETKNSTEAKNSIEANNPIEARKSVVETQTLDFPGRRAIDLIRAIILLVYGFLIIRVLVRVLSAPDKEGMLTADFFIPLLNVLMSQLQSGTMFRDFYSYTRSTRFPLFLIILKRVRRVSYRWSIYTYY